MIPRVGRQFFNIFMILTFVGLAACGAANGKQSVSDETIQTPGSHPPVGTIQPEPTLSTRQGDTSSTPTESPLPTSSPTPAATLADWRDAPISPDGISQRVLDIYQEGVRQGRNVQHFSVIGDCQSIPFVFMGPFGRGAQEPDASESHLWRAITAFDSSFKRWSVTARGGFTAASILNALQADPQTCKPGETPLTCEFRINNPAFVLITLETWLDPETVDRYEIYLRRILDTVIENGAIPILLTKADASELKGERHVLNPVIVNLAYEYQIPVVNFWRAAQYLDNYGIDPDREGFHLSESGYRLKNTLALRALYQVWTAVQPDPEAGISSPDLPPATRTETIADRFPEPQLAHCSSGCIFFDRLESVDGEIRSHGVYAYNPELETVTEILGEGYTLQYVSSDGGRMLINIANYLYEIKLDTGEVGKVSDTFDDTGQLGAFWDAEGELVYLDRSAPIESPKGKALSLIPDGSVEGSLTFEAGLCQSDNDCVPAGVFHRDAEGTIVLLTDYRRPVYSDDGRRVAFLNAAAATSENYYHIPYLITEETATGLASRRVLYLPEERGFEVYPEVIRYVFSPSGDKLFILYDVYSEYYEKSLRLQMYLWDLNNGILYDMGKVDGPAGSLNPQLVWSPDGDRLLFFLTDQNEDDAYTVSLYQTDLKSGEKLTPIQADLHTGEHYFYLNHMYWR